MSDLTQADREVGRGKRQPKKRRRIISGGQDHILTADLVDMSQFAKWNKKNGKQMKFILFILELHSRYAWGIPLANKNAGVMKQTLDDFFQKMPKNRRPELLWTDRGQEFTASQVKQVFQKYDIKLYHTFGDHKGVVIERLNRTIGNRIRQQLEGKQNKKWLDLLDKEVREYNHSEHRTIKAKPADVYNGDSEPAPHEFVHGKDFKATRPKFKVGDRVRIARTKGTFERGFDANWTRELFRVQKVLKTNPVTYKLKDENGEMLEGSFYQSELQKTELTDEGEFAIEKVVRRFKRNGTQMAEVKWLGFNHSQNSILPASRVRNLK